MRLLAFPPSSARLLVWMGAGLALGCGTNTKNASPGGAVIGASDAPAPGYDAEPPDDAGAGGETAPALDTGDAGEDGSGGHDGTYTDDDDPDPSVDADRDGDGLSDAVEDYICSDNDAVDSDGDGLWDGEEIYDHGTDPLCADSDGDGLTDSRELHILGSDPMDPNDPEPTASPSPECEEGCDGSTADLSVDHDGDSLTLLEELECGSDDFARDASHDPTDSDGDGLGDADECASVCLKAWDADTDGDRLMDGDEASLGLDACDADSDADGREDGDELLVAPLSDPTLPDTDGDGLLDGDELTWGCDPNHADTDVDGLGDVDEVAAGTDCDHEDTDGDGMKDAAELSTVGGKSATDPLDASDVPEFIDPEAGDVWTCSVMSEVDVSPTGVGSSGGELTTFPSDSAYYGSYYEFTDSSTGSSTFISQECACEDILIAATGPLDIAGVTVWAEDAVHAVDYTTGSTSYTSRNTQANWATKSVPAGVAFTQGSGAAAGSWLVGAQALYSDTDPIIDEHAMSGSDPVWAAFYESTATPDGTSAAATDPTGLVSLRVSRMSAPEQIGSDVYRYEISDCGELQWDGSLGNGLQFRVDLVSPYAVRPPSHTASDAAESCRAGAAGQTRFGLASLRGQAPRPIPLSGSARYAHARATRIRVARWNGADALQLTHPSGAQVHLSPAADAVVLPGAGWLLSETRFDVGRAGLGMADPVLEVEHVCTGSDLPPAGPVAVPGFLLSYAQVDEVLGALGLGAGMQALWPELSDLSQSPLRLRLELPERFVDGPDRAWLRLDVAGVGTLYKVPMVPDLVPGLRDFTHPAEVQRWTLHSRNRARTVGGSIEQGPTGLQVVLHTLALGDSTGLDAQLSTPLVFTLPAE